MAVSPAVLLAILKANSDHLSVERRLPRRPARSVTSASSVFSQRGLAFSDDDKRRVLAVLTYLKWGSQALQAPSGQTGRKG